MKTHNKDIWLLPFWELPLLAGSKCFETKSRLLRLFVAQGCVNVMFLGICFLIFATVGNGTLLSAFLSEQSHSFLSYTNSFYKMNSFIFLIAFSMLAFAFFLSCSMFKIATIVAIDEKNKKLSLTMIFSQSLSRFVPFLFVEIISLLLAFGGFFAFFLPGLLIYYFLVFASYVAICEKVSTLRALEKSVSLVLQKPSAVLLRFFILLLITVGIGHTFSSLPNTLLTYILFVGIYMLFGWYSTSYIYLLYKDIASKTQAKKYSSLAWIIPTALLGWVIAIGIFLQAPHASSFLTEAVKQYSQHATRKNNALPPVFQGATI